MMNLNYGGSIRAHLGDYMKSTSVKYPSPEIYPRLMECVVGGDKGTVVLFYGPNKGTVVSGDGSPIGYFSSAWNMLNFVEFHGTITLEN